MKVRYIGAGDDPPARCVFRGIPFERGGEPVEVSDKEILLKLAKNRCFEFFDDIGPRSYDEAAILAGGGTPGGELGVPPVVAPPHDHGELFRLRQRIEAAGYKVDGRWGLERLRQEAASVDG